MEESLVKGVEESSERRGEEVVGEGSTMEWGGHGSIGGRVVEEGEEGEREREEEEKRKRRGEKFDGEENRLDGSRPSKDTNWHASLVYYTYHHLHLSSLFDRVSRSI